MGAHFDGLIAVLAHTTVATSDPTQEITGRRSDAICAAHIAGEAALRMCRPGNTNTQVTAILNEIATSFNCKLLEGVVSHRLERFKIEGEDVIAGRLAEGQSVQEFSFQENHVYAIDIVMSTGNGRAQQQSTRTTVFSKEANVSYGLKMKASNAVLGEINKRFPSFPFSLRALEDESRARLGITECVKHQLVKPYPVVFEKPGEIIAQFKFTVLILPSSISKITFNTALPYVVSTFSVGPNVQKILDTGLKRTSAAAKSKKKKKKSCCLLFCQLRFCFRFRSRCYGCSQLNDLFFLSIFFTI